MEAEKAKQQRQSMTVYRIVWHALIAVLFLAYSTVTTRGVGVSLPDDEPVKPSASAPTIYANRGDIKGTPLPPVAGNTAQSSSSFSSPSPASNLYANSSHVNAQAVTGGTARSYQSVISVRQGTQSSGSISPSAPPVASEGANQYAVVPADLRSYLEPSMTTPGSEQSVTHTPTIYSNASGVNQ
jgi:hypothetical protein